MKKTETKHGIAGFPPHRPWHAHASIAILPGTAITSANRKLSRSDIAAALKMYTHIPIQKPKKEGAVF
nr:hypothetical protein [uncultured Oscillibacter sp.]